MTMQSLSIATGEKWRRLALIAPAAILVAITAGCDREAPADKTLKPVEVIVTVPITGTVADYEDFTGRLDAFKSVEIRPRVSGYITAAPFKEGDLVQEGDLLFEIDRRPYQAALDQAQAQVRLQEANQKYQDALYQRDQQVLTSGAVAREELEKDRAARDTARASVVAAKANVETADLNLKWTQVRAPLSGRVSRRNVDPGNLVNADNTILTTLVMDDRVYLYFDVNERTYLDLPWRGKIGQNGQVSPSEAPVLMRLANEKDFTQVGHVDFIDNQVNGTSGTIRMRGVFANQDAALKKGLFARVRLPLGKPYSAILIPDEALLSDQGRKFVYVVDAKSEAKYRAVEVGQAVQGLRVIKKGLAMGERVIVSGLQRVRPNAKVEAKTQEPPKPPESRLATLIEREAADLKQASQSAPANDTTTGRPRNPRATQPGG